MNFYLLYTILLLKKLFKSLKQTTTDFKDSFIINKYLFNPKDSRFHELDIPKVCWKKIEFKTLQLHKYKTNFYFKEWGLGLHTNLYTEEINFPIIFAEILTWYAFSNIFKKFDQVSFFCMAEVMNPNFSDEEKVLFSEITNRVITFKLKPDPKTVFDNFFRDIVDWCKRYDYTIIKVYIDVTPYEKSKKYLNFLDKQKKQNKNKKRKKKNTIYD